MVAFIRLFGCTKAGILAHRPQTRTIHGGLYAASEGKFAWVAQLLMGSETLQIFFREQVWYFDMRTGLKGWLSLRRLFFGLACSRLAPFFGIVADMQVHSNSLHRFPMAL